MSNERRALEPVVKDFVAQNGRFFGYLGDNVIAEEKSIGYSKQQGTKKTIADMLVFSMVKGVIGIEIKTEYDNLRRLNRQMRGYSLVCDYVWVVCHDKHAQAVEDSNHRHNHGHVGIIAYAEVNDVLVGGVYKKAERNPFKSVYHTANILWKNDLLVIMAGLRFPSRIASKELGFRNLKNDRRDSYSTAPPMSRKMSKRDVITNMIARFGEEELTRMVCKYFIEGSNPNKVLNIKHFNPEKLHRAEREGGRPSD